MKNKLDRPINLLLVNEIRLMGNVIVAALEDEPTRRAVTAERAVLSGLGGGCAVPVAAYAAALSGQPLVVSLTGLVISEDGRKAVHVKRAGTDVQLLGYDLAQRAIAQGANEILGVEVAA